MTSLCHLQQTYQTNPDGFWLAREVDEREGMESLATIPLYVLEVSQKNEREEQPPSQLPVI